MLDPQCACVDVTGRVLRAACPIDASEEDVLVLLEMLQITRLVSLLDEHLQTQTP